MLEHTNERLTEVELRFTGPKSKRQEAIALMAGMGFVAREDCPDWRAAFPGLDGNEPGVCLAGARHRENLTQSRLGELCGIPQRHISEMENGKRPIGKEVAKKLALVLHTDYRVFL